MYPTTPTPSPLATGKNPGVGAAFAEVINREQNYRRALNSPTAQANRMAVTGNPLPLKLQKAGYMPPEWSDEQIRSYRNSKRGGEAGSKGPTGAAASPYRRKLTPAEGIAYTRQRTAQLDKSFAKHPASAPTPTTTDPNAGLQSYARQKLGGTEFRTSRRHPARDPKARMGEFAGMTPDQASIAAENQYAGLSAAEKTQWANRSGALQNPVAQAPAPAPTAPKPTGAWDTLVNLFRGDSAPDQASITGGGPTPAPAAPVPRTTAAQPAAKRPPQLGTMSSYRLLKPRQSVLG